MSIFGSYMFYRKPILSFLLPNESYHGNEITSAIDYYATTNNLYNEHHIEWIYVDECLQQIVGDRHMIHMEHLQHIILSMLEKK